jgi:sulfate transport system substrate-binding protein
VIVHTNILVRLLAVLVTLGASAAGASPSLLNVSYDVTREFYRDYNVAFAAHWKAEKGESVTIKQSHGGSSKQARSVLDGLQADVVTMNQATDIDVLAKAGRVVPDWAQRFPERASPFTSTIVFVVRKGNAKGIQDWSDLVREGLQVIVPNPKTSGNGRYSYLAAWGYALESSKGDQAAARAFVSRLFKNVPVLDTGGRGATTTFAQRGSGDVLLTFENEAHLTLKELGSDQVEIVTPQRSILAEAPVALVDRIVDKRGTREVATAYLKYLYSPESQKLAAQHFFRPRAQDQLTANRVTFPNIRLFTIEQIAGSWAEAQRAHFDDGGIFDQIYLQ